MTPRLPARARYALPLLALGAVAAVVALAEIGIAHTDPGLIWRDPASGDDGLQFYRFHPEVGLFHKPSFRGEYRGVVYETNAMGLRGPALSREPDPDRPRILLLGDSLVWGYGVAADDTLRAALARLRPGLEWVNLGVAGFGTGQEWMLLRAEGLPLRPSRVVLLFTLANDVEDTFVPDSVAAYPANLFWLDPQGRLRVQRFELSPWERLGLWLRHHSYLVASLSSPTVGSEGSAPERGSSRLEDDYRRRLAALPLDLDRYAALDYLARPGLQRRHLARRGGLLAPTPLNHYKVELVKQILLAMDRDVRDAGAELVVVLAPFRAQLSGDPVLRDNPLAAELSRFLAEAGIVHLDLMPSLQGAGLPPDRLYLDGMHFSARGNRVVAAAVADALLPRTGAGRSDG